MRAYAYLPIVFVSNLPWWQDAALGARWRWRSRRAGHRRSASRRSRRAVRRHAPVAPRGGRLRRGRLRALLPPAGRQADRLRCLRAATFTYCLLLTVPALARGAVRLRAGGAAAVLARPGALRHRRDLRACSSSTRSASSPSTSGWRAGSCRSSCPAALLFACRRGAGGHARPVSRARDSCAALWGRVPRAAGAAVRARGAAAARPRRVRRDHPEARTASPPRFDDDDLLIVESRDASDTHVLGLPLAYIYDRNVLLLRSRLPDKSAFALVPRLGPHAVRAGAVHGRRRHRAAVARDGTCGRSPASVSRCRSTRRAARGLPADGAAEGVRLQPLRVRAACGARRSGRSTSTSAPRTTCTSCASTPRSRPTGGRSAGRATRRTSRSPRCRVGSRDVTLWMDDGGRPPAAPPAEVTVSLQLGFEAGKPPSVDRLLGTVRVRAASSPTPSRFRRIWRNRRGVRHRARPAEAGDAGLESAAGAGHRRRPRPRGDGRSRGGKITES